MMQKKGEAMKSCFFPSGKIMTYNLTGKFMAPSDTWQHARFDLTDFELFVMTEGTLYISYAEENFQVSNGEYLLLPPKANAWRQGFQPAYCEFYWLHFSYEPSDKAQTSSLPSLPAFPGACQESVFSIPQQGKIPKPEKMVILMKQLQDSVKNNYPKLALNAMATCVLTELYSQLYLHSHENTSFRSGKQIYSDILDYVKLHISENIKVTDIAAHFGYNAKYLSHLFAEFTGISLKQFILNQKMDTASFMLTDSNQSIGDIARALGFSDSHNFSRAYKRVTGLTPSEYRNTFDKRLLYHV